jgi:spore coat polysaccharide biosynthesis protein SpsF
MADVGGVPLIDRVIGRTTQSHLIEKVVVATTGEPADDALTAHLQRRGIAVYRGSRDDVLDRYYRCAELHGATVVVRVTADDPLKDRSVIDRAIGEIMSDASLDYCSNTLKPSYPEGLDIEVVRMRALARAQRDAVLASEREHVTAHIWKRPELFNLRNIAYERDLSDWRLTVDHPADLELVRRIFEHFSPVGDRFDLDDLISFLDSRPDLRTINDGHLRNEGYLKSIQGEHEHERH